MPNLPVTAFLLGYCGVIYEFAFAQTLSVLFGQSVVQYSVTIGLFLAGMGAGSHFSERLRDARLSLWRTQLILSVAVPLIFICVWWTAVSGGAALARALAYVLCFSVGAVTGAELPLMMRLAPDSTPRILAADYAGMLAACLAFPLLLLPHQGVFAAVLSTAAVNATVLLVLEPRRAGFLLLPATLLLSLWFEPGLREWLSLKLTAA